MAKGVFPPGDGLDAPEASRAPRLAKIFAQVCTDSGASLVCTKFAQPILLHTFCTRFSSRDFPQMHRLYLKLLDILVTVWAMKILNESSMGSGENTPLIGSSPVVGTILFVVQKADLNA
jgi:hypothetical protein